MESGEKTIKGIIFDVDGVLLDSERANLYFYQTLMQKCGYPAPTEAQHRAIHFYSMYDAIRVFSGVENESEIKKIWEIGKTLEVGGVEACMMNDAENVLKQLHKNYVLGIVTNRVRTHIFEGEEFLKLQNLFHAVVAYEDTVRHKPDPEPVLLAVSRLGLEPHECVFIGDAETDMMAGRSAGTATLLFKDDFSQLPKRIRTIVMSA